MAGAPDAPLIGFMVVGGEEDPKAKKRTRIKLGCLPCLHPRLIVPYLPLTLRLNSSLRRPVVAMPGLEIPGEFLRHALLDTVVPHAPGIDIEAALTSALEDGADDLPSVLSSIPQRSLLFFGR